VPERELGEPRAIAKPGLCARLMGPFNFISILLSEMPFEAVAFGKRLSGISGTAARRRMEAKSRSNRPRSLRLFSINSDAASCGRAPDCKIDWARKIHRCRSRLPYTAQW